MTNPTLTPLQHSPRFTMTSVQRRVAAAVVVVVVVGEYVYEYLLLLVLVVRRSRGKGFQQVCVTAFRLVNSPNPSRMQEIPLWVKVAAPVAESVVTVQVKDCPRSQGVFCCQTRTQPQPQPLYLHLSSETQQLLH